MKEAAGKVTAKYNEDVSLHAKEQNLLPSFIKDASSSPRKTRREE